MKEHQASRTLLKSPPELWAECSDAQSLAKHLGDSVGEIQITKLEPEHTVAWEGDRASGTVKLEPSGWGTRVTLTCSTPAGQEVAPDSGQQAPEPAAVAPQPDADPAPEPAPAAQEPDPEPRRAEPPRGGVFARMRRFFAPEQPAVEPVVPAPEPTGPEPTGPEPTGPEPPPPSPAAAEPPEASETDAALAGALASLGQAHHRPFSRA